MLLRIIRIGVMLVRGTALHTTAVSLHPIENGMNQLFIHQGHVSIRAQRYLNRMGLDQVTTDAADADMLLFEGIVLRPDAGFFHIELLSLGEWWNPHQAWLVQHAKHIRALAHAERNVSLHAAIVSECTTPRERIRLLKIWDGQ